MIFVNCGILSQLLFWIIEHSPIQCCSLFLMSSCVPNLSLSQVTMWELGVMKWRSLRACACMCVPPPFSLHLSTMYDVSGFFLLVGEWWLVEGVHPHNEPVEAMPPLFVNVMDNGRPHMGSIIHVWGHTDCNVWRKFEYNANPICLSATLSIIFCLTVAKL